MTEENDPQKNEKPKIKLGGSNPDQPGAENVPADSGSQAPPSKDVTMPLSMPVPPKPFQAAGDKKPGISKPSISKPSIAPTSAKSETSRISLDKAKPPTPNEKAKEGIPLSEEQEEQLKNTMRIEGLPDGIHAPHEVEGGMQALGHEPPKAASNATMKIDLSIADDGAEDIQDDITHPGAAVNQTMRIETLPDGIHEDAKANTGQIPSAANNATMKISAAVDSKDDVNTDDTQAISLDVTPDPSFDPETKKDQTSRVSLNADKLSQDVLKRRTGKISIPVPPPTIQATVEQGQKSVTKPGLSIKKPGSVASKTGPVIPPVKKTTGPVPTGSGKLEQTRKLGTTSTLKLDLPPELKSIKPKTMTIKRADGTTSSAQGGPGMALKNKPGAITDDDDAPQLSMLKSLDESDYEEEETPGAVFAVLSLLALVVSLVVVYVLLGQTFLPDIPFAGRI